MPWNHMQVELVPADLQARPMIGPGNLSREEALRNVQHLLDEAAKLSPPLAQTARIWKAGAKDDTVYAGSFIWTVYEHPDGEDPRRAALAWMEDLAQIMRSAGVNVQVARFPD